MSLKVLTKHLQGQHNQKDHAPNKKSSSAGKVWDGQKMEWEGKKPSRLAVGEAGEELAMRVLSEQKGMPYKTLNEGINNAPIDVAGDSEAVEVKTGLATNGKSAQHWRATIGQPGKAEQKLLKQMTREEKLAHNTYKRQQIMQRKQDMLDDMSEIAGKEIKPVTVGIVMHPDMSKGDVYKFEGFHQRIPWNKIEELGGEYLGTHEL